MNDIRCLILDVDGVMTDGRLHIDTEGRSGRTFHVHDGLAIHWFGRLGGLVAIISGKKSPAVDARARELGIEHVIQDSQDKLADLTPLLRRHDLRMNQVAMIADDLPDLSILRNCGYPIAVANAVAEVKAVARMVTKRSGGNGAVREAIEYLLRDSGRWQEVVEHYDPPPPTGDDT